MLYILCILVFPPLPTGPTLVGTEQVLHKNILDGGSQGTQRSIVCPELL